MTPGEKTTEQITKELGVTKWFAMSGNANGKVHSAIINVRRREDRRYVKKVYIYFNQETNNYTMDKA